MESHAERLSREAAEAMGGVDASCWMMTISWTAKPSCARKTALTDNLEARCEVKCNELQMLGESERV